MKIWPPVLLWVERRTLRDGSHPFEPIGTYRLEDERVVPLAAAGRLDPEVESRVRRGLTERIAPDMLREETLLFREGGWAYRVRSFACEEPARELDPRLADPLELLEPAFA